ncbi:MAG: hypothetical protein ABSD56_15925 [Bryobacteraceae bacterium]
MWDVIDTIGVVVVMCFLAYFWWTASRTVLDFSGRVSHEERVRGWTRMAIAAGIAALLGGLVLLVQHLVTGH